MYDILATVFEDNWKLQEHVFVSGMLCLQIMLTKEQEFRENFQVYDYALNTVDFLTIQECSFAVQSVTQHNTTKHNTTHHKFIHSIHTVHENMRIMEKKQTYEAQVTQVKYKYMLQTIYNSCNTCIINL